MARLLPKQGTCQLSLDHGSRALSSETPDPGPVPLAPATGPDPGPDARPPIPARWPAAARRGIPTPSTGPDPATGPDAGRGLGTGGIRQGHMKASNVPANSGPRKAGEGTRTRKVSTC